MVITIPTPSAPPAVAACPFAAMSARMHGRHADFLRLVATADGGTSPAWRQDQRQLSPLQWTGRICQKVESRPFQPLSVAMEATFALMRRFDFSVDEVGVLMERANVLDTMAVAPDVSRDDPAWIALIISEARNWHDEGTFGFAMVEVAVWAFRAWVITLPAVRGSVRRIGG